MAIIDSSYTLWTSIIANKPKWYISSLSMLALSYTAVTNVLHKRKSLAHETSFKKWM